MGAVSTDLPEEQPEEPELAAAACMPALAALDKAISQSLDLLR